MGLAPFDNIWYCDKCGESFNNERDFVFCPMCGNVLKNDWYQMSLQSIVKFLKKFERNVCESCDEEFGDDYNFCPYCSNELKKEGIFNRLEKDNSIVANWNGEEKCVFDRSIFLYSPHFSRDAVIKCFEDKCYLDSKLESDFLEIGEKPPRKLDYEEAFSIVRLGTGGVEILDLKFIPKPDKEVLDDEHFNPESDCNAIIDKDYDVILKIRKDLYVKIKLKTVCIY